MDVHINQSNYAYLCNLCHFGHVCRAIQHILVCRTAASLPLKGYWVHTDNNALYWQHPQYRQGSQPNSLHLADPTDSWRHLWLHSRI